MGHFNALLNVRWSLDFEYVLLISELPTLAKLDKPLTLAEIVLAVS